MYAIYSSSRATVQNSMRAEYTLLYRYGPCVRLCRDACKPQQTMHALNSARGAVTSAPTVVMLGDVCT